MTVENCTNYTFISLGCMRAHYSDGNIGDIDCTIRNICIVYSALAIVSYLSLCIVCLILDCRRRLCILPWMAIYFTIVVVVCANIDKSEGCKNPNKTVGFIAGLAGSIFLLSGAVFSCYQPNRLTSSDPYYIS
jgi:hypothetical protein